MPIHPQTSLLEFLTNAKIYNPETLKSTEGFSLCTKRKVRIIHISHHRRVQPSNCRKCCQEEHRDRRVFQKIMLGVEKREQAQCSGVNSKTLWKRWCFNWRLNRGWGREFYFILSGPWFVVVITSSLLHVQCCGMFCSILEVFGFFKNDIF